MSDRVRVLRLIEYTYPSLAAAVADMARWGVPAHGSRSWGREGKTLIHSTVLGPLPGDDTEQADVTVSRHSTESPTSPLETDR